MKRIDIENLTTRPYNFDLKSVSTIEKKYPGSSYIGVWQHFQNGYWTDNILDVFYDPKPAFELGHSHYFGFFRDYSGKLFVTKAESIFKNTFTGIKGLINEKYYLSSHRHDYQDCGAAGFIDGGRDYIRYDPTKAVDVKIICEDGMFFAD